MQPTFLTALHIYNVRHLKNVLIPLSSEERKNLILTGKNGSGKTSVLEALVEHFKYIVTPNSFTKERAIELSHSSIDVTRDLGNRALKYWENGAVPDYNSIESLKEKYAVGTFILAYYGDKRAIEVLVSKNIEKVDLKPVYTMSDRPSKELVKYLVDLKTTQAFAKTQGNEERAKEIENWFQRFEKILRTIYDDPALKLDFDIENFRFSIILKDRQPFDFNTMSMGYAAVFDIIGDLIMRMESQRRYDLEGVVLIDEIETHLHVELQKKIVPILAELFPNLQFILTTHSPFILNSAPNAVIYDLEQGTLVENGLTDLPYEGIIEGYFKADLLSQKLREKFDRYCKLIKKSNLTEADYTEIAELELYLDEIPDYLALDLAVEYGKLKLEFAARE